MNGREKSDPAIVARKLPNGAGQPAEEAVERRACPWHEQGAGAAGGDPGLEHPATDTVVAGRHRPQAQPASQRADRILRALRAFGIVSDAQVRQSDTSQMG